MSYKEIQVPSSLIQEVYSKALAELEPLEKSHYLKYEEKREIYRKHQDRMVSIYDSLWSKAKTTKKVVYIPSPFNFTLSPSISPVHQFISECKSTLQGSKLADEMTLTESQVSDLEFYRKGKATEQCKQWFNSEVDLYNPYKSLGFGEESEKDKENSVEIEKEDRTIPETQLGGFWLGFFVSLALLTLFLIF